MRDIWVDQLNAWVGIGHAEIPAMYEVEGKDLASMIDKLVRNAEEFLPIGTWFGIYCKRRYETGTIMYGWASSSAMVDAQSVDRVLSVPLSVGRKGRVLDRRQSSRPDKRESRG